MPKFIQTIDDDGDRVIINLEAIVHVVKIVGRLRIYFSTDDAVILKGEQADIFWEMLSEQSLQLQSKKIGVEVDPVTLSPKSEKCN